MQVESGYPYWVTDYTSRCLIHPREVASQDLYVLYEWLFRAPGRRWLTEMAQTLLYMTHVYEIFVSGSGTTGVSGDTRRGTGTYS